jgi:NAD+ synthase (glutamine-hydrolysing)
MLSEDLRIEKVHDALIEGIRDFFSARGSRKGVIGLSGGLDSAVVATLAVKALGKENIHGILMPSEFSTLHSIQDAVDLADSLDIKYNIIPISTIYKKFIKELQPIFGVHNKWNVAEEHLQARIRCAILMAYANKFNALLLNTTNKSELYVGYGTQYGDLAGAVMVLGDLYKSEVYELATYINCEDEYIPESSIVKAPSDELRTDQKDSDTLPEYQLLDRIIHALNEEGKTEEALISEGYDADTVKTIIGLHDLSLPKLHQIPQILNVSKKPLAHESKWLLK